jgi:hypothetical protein
MTGGTSGGGSPIGAGYGTVTLNGGSYSSSGTHSPGILAAGISPTFSSVTVNEGASGAAISASNDAAVVVEGGNTVTINSPTNLTTISGAGGDYHGIFLYLGGTGDASAGPGTFAMTGGTIVYTCDATPTSANPCDGSGSASLAADQNYPATVFAATNTTSTAPTNISLTDVTVINTTPSDIDLNNTNGTLLTAAALSLGNPAYVNFTAKGEQLIGDIIVDTNSIVNLTLEADANSIGSSLTGNIGGPTTYYLNQTVGTVNLTIDANSTWVVSGNSYVTTLHNSGSGNISCQNFGQCAVYVGGSTTPLAGVN